MMSYPFFKSAAMASQFYFRFRFSWLCSDTKVDIYLHRKISAWYLNHRPRYYYFRFLKTNVRQVGILLPVPILRLRHHQHVILQLPTKCRLNQTIRDRVMRSCPFLKMAATASQFYFLFRFSWFRSSGKDEIYRRTKLRRDISIHGCDVTTSSFWKQTSAMLEFYFWFRFLHLHHQSSLTCHSVSAYQISSKLDHLQQSYDVIFISQDGGRQPYWIISTLLQTTYEVQIAVSDWSSNFELIGFIVSEVLLFLCYEILPWNFPFTWLYPPRMRRMRG